MRQKNLVTLLLALPLFSLAACGNMEGGSAQTPSFSPPLGEPSPIVRGIFNRQPASTTCRTDGSQLQIAQNVQEVWMKGGFDYGQYSREGGWEFSGSVDSENAVLFTIKGKEETLSCIAALLEPIFQGTCTLKSGETCDFVFSRASGVTPDDDEDKTLCLLSNLSSGSDYVAGKLAIVFPFSSDASDQVHTLLEDIGAELITGTTVAGTAPGIGPQVVELYNVLVFSLEFDSECDALNRLRREEITTGLCYLPTEESASCYWVVDAELVPTTVLSTEDRDNDGVPSVIDNCPDTPNPGQERDPNFSLRGAACVPINAMSAAIEQ